MASSSFPFRILFLLAFFCSHVQSHEQGYITAEISSKGLDFLKDLLIEKVESSLVPLGLPEIEKSVKIPLLGRVQMTLSNITIERIRVTSSTLETGDSGITLDVSGGTANFSMNWKYSYSARFVPISISDKGNATVQVEELEVGLTLSLRTVEGSLKLSLLKCGCYMNDLSIRLDGGASWLYQGLVHAFEGKIASAVEDAVSKKINNTIVKLDSLLLSLPREVPVTNIASLNVTFVNDPELSESSVNIEINGLFSATHEVALPRHYHRFREASFSCEEADKMVKISLHQDVLKSVSSVYFKASMMNWIFDKVPNESLLNTAGWSSIIPQLYEKYPNCTISFNLSVSPLPSIKIEKQQIMTTIPLDMVIDVLDVEEVIPVACISTVISSSVSAEFSGKSLAGTVKLKDFTVYLKWSRIGYLPMHAIQKFTSTMLRAVLLPYVNLKLSEGYKIPAFHGYGLQDAHILFANSWIVICTDVTPVNPFGFI